jgi:hypothetical protein
MAMRLLIIVAYVLILCLSTKSTAAVEDSVLEIIASNLQKRNQSDAYLFRPICHIRLNDEEFTRKTLIQLMHAIERVNGETDPQEGFFGLCLQGPGGDLEAALEAVPLLRGWITIVEENRKCLSACAVLFMGGGRHYNTMLDRRLATFDADRGTLGEGRYLHFSAQLGFHAPDYRIFAPDHRIIEDDKDNKSTVLTLKDIESLKSEIEGMLSDLAHTGQLDATALTTAKSKILATVQSLSQKDIITFKQAIDGHERALQTLERLLFRSTIPSDVELAARDPTLDNTRPQIKSNDERIPWTTHQDSDFFPLGLVFSFLHVNGVDEHGNQRFYFIDTVEKALLWGVEIYGLEAPAITDSMLINSCLNYVSLACYQGMPCIIMAGADINSRQGEGGIEFVKYHYLTKRWKRKIGSSSAKYILFDLNKRAQVAEESLGNQEAQLCVARAIYQGRRLHRFDLTTFNARPMWFATNLISELTKDDLTFSFPNSARIWTMVPLDTPLKGLSPTLADLSNKKALFSTGRAPF